MDVVGAFKKLDAFPKVNEDFYSRTFSGGVITVVSSVCMVLLFFNELGLYLRTQTVNELSVDTSRGEQLAIHFDVMFPHLSCAVISLDAMDVSGEQHLDVIHNIFKRRLNKHGNPIDVGTPDQPGGVKLAKVKDKHGNEVDTRNGTFCGSCFGAEETPDDCCNTCSEVREAYRRRGWAFSNADVIEQCKQEGFVNQLKTQEGEGCNIYGNLEVNKVAGNFHFAPGKSFQQANMHVHDLLPFQRGTFNLSHTINKLSFGADFPGVVNPLDGLERWRDTPGGMYQYFLKVVPTIYTDIRGRTISSNQFSVTEHYRSTEEATGRTLPGVFFFYDLSPIKVMFTEERSSFLHFLTNVCAIIGGVFTVSGIVDAFIYHGHKAIKKKMELGKLS